MCFHHNHMALPLYDPYFAPQNPPINKIEKEKRGTQTYFRWPYPAVKWTHQSRDYQLPFSCFRCFLDIQVTLCLTYQHQSTDKLGFE
ncbi:hypothetical protein HanRHA438_Chr11g0506381 [Helianthus annuus]|uniref:Uncharacterized protein n=1 Tax=Helianthus annuus TaxID=4232 RepID=A0A251TBK6_HELAN|nr:hypothetical protein HanXRQr2_Chr11g0493711 [Helianthus annuus]KAJ0501760.1 hypothetical protein HanHA300_Chr11g0404761 [Helianthus annuus]KAJ0509664.1 hypothetical protein HanIR_Chr11g0531651 [Helianthus annuus]KAJ0517683.1 hypothetical protein HanHA89_Chr11g0428441 [Helianthus annuus]KAJ0685700.1 hypothetical protein HanLR1_Chr11g0405941 [Helianthus annuus]